MAEIIDTRIEPERAQSRRLAQFFSDGEPRGDPHGDVYGLAGRCQTPDAISRIYEMKGRPRFNPLICHVSDLAMAEAL